jgi:hypothetical protein
MLSTRATTNIAAICATDLAVASISPNVLVNMMATLFCHPDTAISLFSL